jgi:NTP pyrophosphatase (non-canonical NTP hydrolase)
MQDLTPVLREADMADALEELRDALREFARARDWEQFHSPRNLATAVAVEAGELLEHFQWLRDEDSRALDAVARDAVALEAADVLLCLIRLADALDVDLAATARRKLELNAARYPVALARGSNRKLPPPDAR